MTRVPPVYPARSSSRFSQERRERNESQKNIKHELFRSLLVAAAARELERNELPPDEMRGLSAARDWLHDLVLETATKQVAREPTTVRWQDDKIASAAFVNRNPGISYELYAEFAARDEVWVWWVVSVYEDGVKTRKQQGFAGTRHKAKLAAEQVIL